MDRYPVFCGINVLLLLVAGALSLSGCGEDSTASLEQENTTATAAASDHAPEPAPRPSPAITNNEQTQFNIGNKSYLFDVSNHTVEELEALLQRAEEVSHLQPENYDQLDIVMILHGPDIDWFTTRNYEQNRQLVDLAARLDAFEIIDMKVCDTVMEMRGIRREEIPSFIESVPYAPDEMKRLLNEGYINL